MGVPTLSTKTLATDGYTLTIVFNEAVTYQDNGDPVLAVSARSLTNTCTYVSGTATNTLVWNIDTAYPIRTGETVTLSLVAGAVKSSSTDDPNALVSGTSVTNNSATALPACTGTASTMMRNSCAVFRPTYGQSATSAGQTTAWSIPYDAVCCSVQNARTGESSGNASRQSEYDYNGFFSTTPTFRQGDRIINLTGPVGQSGRMYEVVGEPVDHAGLAAYQFLALREVQGNE